VAFYGGVSLKKVMGAIERLRERRRLVNNIKDLFSQEPELAKRIQEILEQSKGLINLKNY